MFVRRIKMTLSDIVINKRRLNRRILNFKGACDEINDFLNPKCENVCKSKCKK